MAATIIITRDADLREQIQRTDHRDELRFVEDCTALDAALDQPMGTVLVDLNLEWDQDIAHCIARCRQEGGASHVIAFLHEQAGETAIRAHLAGADRVIPQSQLEQEIAEILGT